MQYQPQPITPGLQIQANPRPGISPGVAALMNQRTMPPTRPPVSGGARMAPGALPVKPGQYATKPMQMPPQMPPEQPMANQKFPSEQIGQPPVPPYMAQRLRAFM